MSRIGIRTSPRQNPGISMRATVTTTIRSQTNGKAGNVMVFPRIAVKPQRTTQKCICSQARVEAVTL